MKRVFFLVFTGVLTAVSAFHAFAWEFSVRSEAEWRYRYVSRTGPGDMFGNALVAQASGAGGTSIGLAGPQGLAVRVEAYSSKGSDAAYAEQRLFFYPRIRVNDAIDLKGILAYQANLNGSYENMSADPLTGRWRSDWTTNPHYSGWIMVDSRHVHNGVGFTVPVMRGLWGVCQMPVGTLLLGRRPAGFGLGWVVHEDDVFATSVTLVVPYGPMTFALSQYLHDNGEYTDPNDSRNGQDPRVGINSSVDQNEVRDINSAAAVVYRNGSIDAGVMVRAIRSSNVHSIPQLNGTFRDDANFSFAAFYMEGFHSNVPEYGPIYGDLFFLLNTGYVKYNDGRFSVNLEYDSQYMDIPRKGGRSLSGYPQAWAAEVSGIFGPAKVTAAHFYRSGHDRRGGMMGLPFAYGQVVTPLGVTYTYDKSEQFLSLWGGADAAINPYNFLVGLYGTGNNSYNGTGACTYQDFAAVAGRMDYALAANLNLFASAMWARRASSTSTPMGFYKGTNIDVRTVMWPVTAVPVPNVPVTDLGWEVDAGFQWKLLENMTAKVLCAYWQPGKWFNWAYRDQTTAVKVLNTGFSWDDDLEGGVVNPNRIINGLFGMQANLLVEF